MKQNIYLALIVSSSGMFGSGLCVFSKYPILETLQHRFAVNGYPSKLLHGDWYAAKSAGLVQLLFEGLRINVYIAHVCVSSLGQTFTLHICTCV